MFTKYQEETQKVKMEVGKTLSPALSSANIHSGQAFWRRQSPWNVNLMSSPTATSSKTAAQAFGKGDNADEY